MLEYVLIIIVIGLIALFMVRQFGISVRCKLLESTAAVTRADVPGLSGCPGAESLAAEEEDDFEGSAPPQAKVLLEAGSEASVARAPPVPVAAPPPAAPPPPPPPPTPSWPPQCRNCHKFQPLGPTDCGPMPYRWVTFRPDMCPKGCCVMTWRR